MSERIKITVLRGVAGYVLAVNDKRVAGPKSGPYKTIAEWKIDPADLPAPAASPSRKGDATPDVDAIDAATAEDDRAMGRPASRRLADGAEG